MRSSRKSMLSVLTLLLALLTLAFAPSRASAQMSSVVNSLDDDILAFPYDDTATVDVDESIDGICGDYAGRCTFRAAIEEAWAREEYANITFAVAGVIQVDSTLGTYFLPPGSTINGNGRAVAFRGSGSYAFLMSLDSQTTVKGLVFRNCWDALDVYGKHNIIGGNVVTEGNMFLGAEQNAIFLLGDSNLVVGNQVGIGEDVDPIGVAPNGDTVYNQFGIFVLGSHNIIGDSMETRRNIISRNTIGISMVGTDSTDVPCVGNSVRGNMIGTDFTGTSGKSNGYGIEFLYGEGHLVGGAAGSGFNIISGNREAGILVGVGTNDVTIAENLIGLNIAQAPLGNQNGIILGPGSSDCLVYNNLIQQNSGYGIEIAGGHAGFDYPSTRHIVAGNKVNFNGLGILMGAKATENVIGSSLAVDREPNEIQSNTQGGVLIASPVGTPNEARLNTVRKNLFLDNYEDGIVIVQSQDDIVPPSLLNYTVVNGQAWVTGKHDRIGSLIDVYEGKKFNDTWYEGYTWLGSATVQGDSNFTVSFADCGCNVVAATATDPAGNTSAFSILQQGVEVILANLQMNQGWNMSSVPVNPVNPLADSIFAGATSGVFAYTPSGYTAQDSLSVGRGYWVRYPSAGPQPVSGYAVNADTFGVMAGWNLIGSITGPVPVSQVASIPGGMIATGFFEYNGFYQASDTIRPGRAYWVKVGQAGSLVLAPSGEASAANRIRIAETTEMPPDPPGPDAAARPFPRPFIVALGGSPGGASDPATLVRYWLPAGGPVTVKVTDRSGREIAVLADGVRAAGFHTERWSTAGVPDGAYHCRLTAGDHTAVGSLRLKRPIR